MGQTETTERALAQAKLLRGEKPCNWDEDCDGIYETDCDKSFTFDYPLEEDPPNFCRNCGRPVVLRHFYEDDGE